MAGVTGRLQLKCCPSKLFCPKMVRTSKIVSSMCAVEFTHTTPLVFSSSGIVPVLCVTIHGLRLCQCGTQLGVNLLWRKSMLWKCFQVAGILCVHLLPQQKIRHLHAMLLDSSSAHFEEFSIVFIIVHSAMINALASGYMPDCFCSNYGVQPVPPAYQ